MDTTPYYGLLGAPSSMGAKTPGTEKAPAVLRAAGLVEQFQRIGGLVDDHGDLPVFRHLPDPINATAQNVTRVAAVTRYVNNCIEDILAAGQAPLLIGGDSTISLGFVSAFSRRYPNASLLSMGGGVHLKTPASTAAGNLDSMSVAHLLGLPGTDPALNRIGAHYPLLSPSQVLYYGYELTSCDDAEQQIMQRYGMDGYTAAEVRENPAGVAASALADLEIAQQPFFVHFDAHVIDFVDCPIADVPAINCGLTFAQAMHSLSVFSQSEYFGGVVITGVNPDHCDADSIVRFVSGLVNALTA